MKRVILTLVWICTATIMASAQTSFFYPHVVNGALGAIVWKTTIILTNPASSGTASGAITFTQDNSNSLVSAGSSWPIALMDDSGSTLTASVFTFTLPPGATRKWVSQAPGSFLSGFANVTTNSGTVNGTAIFSEFDSAGNLVGEAGVPSTTPVSRQTILLDNVGRYSVGLAFANPGGSAANITLTLLDNTGSAVSMPVPATLGPSNHTQAFTSQFFPGVTLPPVGTMQIASSTPLIAIALRFDPTLTKFTTLPPVTLTSLIHTSIDWLLGLARGGLAAV